VIRLILAIFTLLFVFVPQVFAHGGVQNSAGDVTVTFFQEPFLPKVNEQTTLSFILTNKQTGVRLPDYPAALKITEVQDDNPANDKVLLEKDVRSNVNASIETTYKFPTNKIYDIEIEFPEMQAEENAVGFLLQPETVKSGVATVENESIEKYILAIVALSIGIFIGFKLKSSLGK
jgi:hypothetical protein